MLKCEHCSRECKNDNSLRNHQRLCRLNPHRQEIKSNFTLYNEKVRNGLAKKSSNQFQKAREMGLDPPTVSESTRAKLSKASKGRKYTQEHRQKLSKIMKRVVANNPESYTKNNVCGRVKTVMYNGVKLKGSWELEVAKWLDSHNIVWNHEVAGILYEWNGVRTYFPDFYLPDYEMYVEVKGYETDRDRAKWAAVPNLVVFKKFEIELIRQCKLEPSKILNLKRL